VPLFQAMAERANTAFNRRSIGHVDFAKFKSYGFTDFAAGLGVAETEAERAFLDTFPPAIQAAVKAVVISALEREPRLPVTFAWAPGYDFELLVSESKSMKHSIGGITIFLRTRYPGE